MLAEILRGPAYHDNRLRLQTSLDIPIDALDQEIHELIAAGFSAATALTFCELDIFSAGALNQIVPLHTLYTRLARGQNLSLGESERLFRLAHVTAMAAVVFGNEQKAQRWLNKPKQRFAGNIPLRCCAPVKELVWLRSY